MTADKSPSTLAAKLREIDEKAFPQDADIRFTREFIQEIIAALEQQPDAANKDLMVKVEAMKQSKKGVDPWFPESNYRDGWYAACECFLELLAAPKPTTTDGRKGTA